MPEISIIVPVYNTERFVSRCIESILGQSFKDFELILIDDGSTDQSGDICDSYAAKDLRVKVIHQNNRGVSAARNRGLDIAHGKYIYLPDSDDYLESNTLDVMYHFFLDSQIEMVACSYTYRDEGSCSLNTGPQIDSYYDNDELIDSIFGMPNPLGGACWNKMFCAEIIKDVRFEESLSYCEDWFFLFQCFQRINRALQISHLLYNVVESDNSLTRKDPIRAMYNIIQGFEFLCMNRIKDNEKYHAKAINKLIDTCLRYIGLMRKAEINNHQDVMMTIMKVKVKTLEYIVYGWRHHILTKENVHRYLKETLTA